MLDSCCLVRTYSDLQKNLRWTTRRATQLDYDVGDLSVSRHHSFADTPRVHWVCGNNGGFIAMWHTSRGDRTLHGSEALLVSNAIDTMVDSLLLHLDIDADEDFDEASQGECESGIGVYDAFTAPQRIGLLHEVAQHLLRDTPQVVALSAALEATIAAIFIEVRDQVAIEISLYGEQLDDCDYPTWRQMVLEAYQSICVSDEVDEFQHVSLSDHGCCEMPFWESLIEQLTDAILWDRDFEMADTFMDIDPGISHHRRKLLGINDDYFTSVAPDPRPEEVFRLVSKTRDIVRAKPR